jgi:GH25 family lysozyme M1 (1,4-beta-N-acetylmuramidase)
MTDELIFSDLSSANIGESIFKNGKVVQTIMHQMDWTKHQAQGVKGTILKAIQGAYLDPGYKIMASSSPLPYNGAYGFLDYTKLHYTIGQEVQWGQKQAQLLCETTSPYNPNLKLAIDYETNAYWEPLDNMPSSNYSFRRANTICLAMLTEIYRLMGYLPILYLNLDVTRQLNKNFWGCPLWIAHPDATPPIAGKNFIGFKDYDLWQYTWEADGKLYGNFTGNNQVDLSKVNHLDNLLVKADSVSTPPVIVTEPVATIEQRLLRLETEAKSHGWNI